MEGVAAENPLSRGGHTHTHTGPPQPLVDFHVSITQTAKVIRLYQDLPVVTLQDWYMTDTNLFVTSVTSSQRVGRSPSIASRLEPITTARSY